MTPHEQFDYALGQLDDGECDQIEGRLEDDPVLADTLDRLRAHLRLMLDDGDDPLPPADLFQRTILRVEIERRRRRTILDFMPSRVSPRWADVAVAASILVAGLLTLLPAVQSSQVAARTAACANNLRVMGIGLNRYNTTHQGFPYPEPDSSLPYVGTFVIKLRDAGLLDDANVLDCPVNGRNPLPSKVPCFAELHAHEQQRPLTSPCLRHNDYAYSLGYVCETERHPLARYLSDDYPILADKPPLDSLGKLCGGNSQNHYGAGQHLLFVGGHVRFLTTRTFGGDRDVYSNDNNLVRTGLHLGDFVLAPSYTAAW